MKSKSYLAITAFAITSMSSPAAVLFYESFSYGVGDLSTVSSNVWNDSGSTIDSGSLSYGSLPTAGNRVTMSDDSSWRSQSFGSALNDGETLWFSLLINTLSGTNPDFGFALGTDRLNDSNNVPMSNSGTGLGFRVKGGIRATSWSSTPSSSSPASYSQGTTVLVVGEMIFGAIDTINIYLPNTDLEIGAVVSTQTASFTQTDFDTIAFSNKTASPRDQVDEIRFATSYDDAVGIIPEPSAFAMFGLGSLMLAFRRRK